MLWLSTWLFTKTPLVWFIESYWRDEAFSILMAQHKWTDISWLTAQDFSPPLYYYLLKVWIMVFGSSEIATRSLSLLCYVMTLFMMVEFLVFAFRFRSRDISPVLIPLGLLTPALHTTHLRHVDIHSLHSAPRRASTHYVRSLKSSMRSPSSRAE